MSAYHESKNEAPDTFADLRGDVGAELLQGGEEPLQFAELTGPARGGKLLRRGGVPMAGGDGVRPFRLLCGEWAPFNTETKEKN